MQENKNFLDDLALSCDQEKSKNTSGFVLVPAGLWKIPENCSTFLESAERQEKCRKIQEFSWAQLGGRKIPGKSRKSRNFPGPSWETGKFQEISWKIQEFSWAQLGDRKIPGNFLENPGIFLGPAGRQENSWNPGKSRNFSGPSWRQENSWKIQEIQEFSWIQLGGGFSRIFLPPSWAQENSWIFQEISCFQLGSRKKSGFSRIFLFQLGGRKNIEKSSGSWGGRKNLENPRVSRIMKTPSAWKILSYLI